MLATLAFMSALSMAPSQGGGLTLVNIRPTYGMLGAPREDAKLLPGDIFFVSFDIDGLTTKDGAFEYSISMEFTNKDGKSEFKRDGEKMRVINTLGGSRLPAFAAAEVGTETKEGIYTLKAIVKDHLTNKSTELKKEFTVLPRSFGLVRLHLTYLQGGQNAPPAPPQLLAAGQSVLINCAAVTFKRDDKTKQPNIGIEIRILDEKGQPTLTEPYKDDVNKDVAESLIAIPIALPLDLNRPGKFSVELMATDRLAKTKFTVNLPLTVLELK